MRNKSAYLFVQSLLLRTLLLVVVMGAVWGSGTAYGQEALQEYRIGPGDKLNITVFGHPDLSVQTLVDGSGRISMPLLGSIPANSISISQLRDEIAAALDKDYIIDPRVTVEVANFRPFYILGDVNKPGSYSYIEGMTARMAVAIAGGFKFRANDLWERDETVSVFHVNDPDKKQNFAAPDDLVLPGDTIEVEQRLFFILGQVNKPGSYSYIEGMTTRMAVAIAGGFKFRATDLWERDETVTVYHENDPEQTKTIAAPDDLVLPGDTIEVEQRLFFILGQVNKPGSYSYIEGMTVRMAVAVAGGFTRRAEEDTVTLIRNKSDGEVTMEVEQDEVVLPGDSIEVDRRLF